MSCYENYSKVSSVYDNGRRPAGVQLYLGLISSQLGKPISEVHLLDAGCGTGSHSDFLLRHGLGRVTMLDASEEMLEIAKLKVEQFIKGNQAEVHHACLPNLPFADGLFDVVMFNQVLHHLKTVDIQHALRESCRVLRSNGMLIINSCSHYQCRHCVWFYGLMTERAMEEMLSLVPDTKEFQEMLTEAGFSHMSRYVSLDGDTLMGDHEFFNFEGVFDENWRTMDSSFTLQTPDEIASMIGRVRTMMRDGSWKTFVDQHEERRQHAGTFTVFVATKSAVTQNGKQ